LARATASCSFAAISADRLRAISERAGLLVETIERSKDAGYEGSVSAALAMKKIDATPRSPT
jgi:hypothetical protein